MTHQASVQLAQALLGSVVEEASVSSGRLGAGLGSRIVEVLAICGNAWAAAHAYEELSRLSDAELDRRGIPRGELHRCVFERL
jgi:3-methyladenine DNA glycosylase Mpg